MSFRLVEKETFDWPVTVKTPNPKNPGNFTSDTFMATFAFMESDEATAKVEALDDVDLDLSAERQIQEQLKRSADFLVDVMTGWRDVVDEENKPITFSEDALRMALKKPRVMRAILEAYREANSGEKASRRRGN